MTMHIKFNYGDEMVILKETCRSCYRAEGAGYIVVGGNPKNTPRMCSNCRNIRDVELGEQPFQCQKCRISKERHLNASINILTTTVPAGSNASGDVVRHRLHEAIVVESGTILCD